MTDGSIAIIGASCRFPGAPDLEAFWELLVSGTDAVSEVGADRWSTRFYYHPAPGQSAKSYTWSAGLISGFDQFEPAFFGISPREAAQMDPQQRVLLELVWHAVEDAGILSNRIAGNNTGVYIGASSTDYRDLRLGDPASGDSYFMTGGTLSILANRVSHVLDLHGPSLTVDTACSSSLVALHHACEAIRSDRIDSAIVGGINLLLAPYPFLGFCRASMLSRRGRCFAFDERADGYVRGEGGGVLILKPLRKAITDGDRIRAVILGTGVNSDGHTIGLSLPSQVAQSALIRAVYDGAGVTADDLAFFEMHGTGTPAGDPIEAAAVGQSLGKARRDPLPIGSVKTNIGHLEPASGMAGLLKATLALDYGVVPPSLHCERPNPNIPFDVLNLRLVRDAEPLGDGDCAGVNSFGFGGTNGHAVLTKPPPKVVVAEDAGAARPPLVLSARSEAALQALAQSWHGILTTASPDRADILLRSVARRRDQHPERLVVLGADQSETVAALADFAAGTETDALVNGTSVRDGKLAFVFAGNGAQWEGMGCETYHSSAAFRTAVHEADAALRPMLGWSVAEMIERGATAEELAHADIAQPLLFAIQVGIVDVLRSLGVEAGANVGHSVGEIAAAWSAGALSLEQAARVVVARSRAQEKTRGDGRMAALALGALAARDLLAEMGSPLEVGAINATQSVTVSGPGEAIERLGVEARRRGIAFRALDLDFAFHSAAMDAIRDGLLTDLTGLSSDEPRDTLVSAVSGECVEAGLLNADYWWRNIRNPVRFTDAMSVLVKRGFTVLVEIGPNPVLQAYLHDALRAGEAQGRVLATLSRKHAGPDPFPAIAARCHVAGYDITGSTQFDGPTQPDGLPLYPWHRERFWFERTAEGNNPANPPFDHPLLGYRQPGPVDYWLNHLDPEIAPWLADHAIEGIPVLPAAAVLEMALAAAHLRRPEASAVEVIDVELRRPMPFDPGRSRELRSVATNEDGDWELSSRNRLTNEPLTLHAVARLTTAGEFQPAPRFSDSDAITGRVDAATLYRLATQLGLDYGPQLRTISDIELLGGDEARAYLDPSAIRESLDPYLIHPALLDGAMQALLALIVERQGEIGGASFLPWRFGRVRLAGPFGRIPHSARLRVTRLGTRSASADVALYDQVGQIVCELFDCWFRRVELTRKASTSDCTLRIDLVPAPLFEADAPAVLRGFSKIIAPLLPDPVSETSQSSEHALLIEALLTAVALQSVLQIVDPGLPFTIDEVVEAGVVAPASISLFEYLLDLLAGFGAAQQTNGGWCVEATNDLPNIAEVWRLLLAEAPDLVAELALIAAAAEEMPRLLAEGPRQSESAPLQMTEHLLHGSPVSAAGIDLACAALATIAENWPSERPLRILEIGADGGATRRLLEHLSASGVALAYTATSPDAEQATRLNFVVATTDGATAACWAPGNGPDELADNRFDVVVSVHACARLGIGASALSDLRDLLAPGGLVMAVEPEPNPLWDIVFGRYAGWWQSGTGAEQVSPLRMGTAWSETLAIAGFDEPGTAPLASGPWPCSVIWGYAPRAADAVGTRPMAASLAITVLATGSADEARREFSAVADHRVEAIEIDMFAAADAAAETEGSNGSAVALLVIAEDQEPITESARLLPLVAKAAAAAAHRQMPLWLVTTGAQQGNIAASAGVIGATVWGFARVLRNEMPRLELHLLDLSPAAPASQRAQIIVEELTAATPETEIVWTATGRHVLRLRRGLPPRLATAQDAVALASEPSGGLDTLGWQLSAPHPPGPGEVSIDVHAAGLNFRDVMWAMGLLPEEALIDGFAGPTYGLECAGIVSAVGPGVEHLAVGDRVAGFAPAALSSQVTTLAQAVTKLPPETSFAAAATVPVTFVTAVYALGTLGQLAPGELVLLHGGAGGVGLAAIQYAKFRGAMVIATSGSEVKRAFLRLAGADHVLDSRDLGFADAVRAISPAGVDVVLNSLSGDAMEVSLGALKPFGRFLELGKRDLYLNRRIHLRPLRQNISYFAIDVDQLPIQRPDLAQSLLNEVSAALAEGAIRPLAHRTIAFGAVGEAFRLMQASGHIGKLVLVPNGNAGVHLHQPPDLVLRRDGTYLVTGGISGFGFAAARWLAQHGAGSIALLGRRGSATPGAGERLAELRALGADARIYAGDVADRAALAEVLAEIRAEQPPLRGVIHAASAIADALATEIDPAGVADILRPKLGGAIALDALTRDDPIELFLMFSSATTLLGAPGQGVYVAANLALEAIARQRRAEDLPALAVAWGPIEDAGYLAERSETREALARRLGAKPMPADLALAGLAAIADSGLAVAALAQTSWSEARRYLPILASPLFAEIRADSGSSPGDASLIERLAGLDTEEALALLKVAIAEETANILRLPASAVDPLRPLSELGMDSLMAVELRLALESRLRVNLPLMSLAEGTSVASIAARLVNAVQARSQTSDVVSLAERYESGDSDGLTTLGSAAGRFDRSEVELAAAE